MRRVFIYLAFSEVIAAPCLRRAAFTTTNLRLMGTETRTLCSFSGQSPLCFVAAMKRGVVRCSHVPVPVRTREPEFLSAARADTFPRLLTYTHGESEANDEGANIWSRDRFNLKTASPWRVINSRKKQKVNTLKSFFFFKESNLKKSQSDSHRSVNVYLPGICWLTIRNPRFSTFDRTF